MFGRLVIMFGRPVIMSGRPVIMSGRPVIMSGLLVIILKVVCDFEYKIYLRKLYILNTLRFNTVLQTR